MFFNKISNWVLLLIFVTVSTSSATSFFSSKGLGMRFDEINTPGFGMGAVGIVQIDQRALSGLNPATFVPAKATRFSIHFQSESIGQKNNAGTGHANYTNAFGGQFLVPLGDNYSFSLGITPLNYTDYSYKSEGGSGEAAYQSIISGKGSLNRLFLGFYADIKNRVALGTTWNYTLGKYDEKWRVNYYSGAYYNTSDALETKLKGFNWSFGIHAKLMKNWNAGAVFTTPLNLNSEHTMVYNYRVQVTEYSFDFARETLDDGSLDIPFSWGIGTSYRLFKRRMMLVSEYFTQPYSQLELDHQEQSDKYNDYHRLSFGLSYKHSENPYDKYIYHIPLRIGFYHKQLQMKYTNQNSIQENAVTFGFGLPFFFNFGRVDFGFALGKRGNLSSNPVEETFFNLMISVTGGERWFIKGSRN